LGERISLQAMLKFIERQWRGDAPFWLSVLVFSLLLPWVTVFGGVSWLSVYTIDATANSSIVAAVLVFTAIAAIAIWQLVGTWRATSKLKAPNRLLITRWLGRAVAAAGFLISAFAFATMPGVVAQYHAEATDADWIGQKGHELTVDGDQIMISGYMSWGLYDEFVKALQENPDLQTVVLNSPGGHYAVGLRMGRMIRERSLNTLTTEMCGSSCTFAFIGGNHRTLQDGARLGFHAMAGNTQVVLDRMQRHASETLKAADVPDEFITRIFETPAEDVWYPTVDELREANVITDVDG
jgi:ATP-dependent protease ClpP protease subunit